MSLRSIGVVVAVVVLDVVVVVVVIRLDFFPSLSLFLICIKFVFLNGSSCFFPHLSHRVAFVWFITTLSFLSDVLF